MTTGMMRSSFICGWVRALKLLQNSMMLTPCCPSAGPTGGDGFALPAGTCNLMRPVTFFMTHLWGAALLDQFRYNCKENRHGVRSDPRSFVHYVKVFTLFRPGRSPARPASRARRC